MEITGNETNWKQQQFARNPTFAPGGRPPRGGPPVGGPPKGGAPPGRPPATGRPSVMTNQPSKTPAAEAKTPEPKGATPSQSKQEESKAPASNIPKAPFIDHFFCWVRGVPFGTAATASTATDTLALPTDATKDLDMSEHPSFNASDEEIDFNPPK